MEYNKFQWTNRSHIDAKNFNNMENGIYRCSLEINKLIEIVKILQEDIKKVKNNQEEVQSIEQTDSPDYEKMIQELQDSFIEHKNKVDKEIKTLKTKVTKLSKKGDEQ